jgi:hypothetical protein
MEENAMSTSPAGWYPQDDGRQRYWDGQEWTEHFSAGQGQPPSGAPAPAPMGHAARVAPGKSQRPWFKKKRVLIPAGLVVLGIFGAATSGGGDTAPASAETNSSAAAATPAPLPKASAKSAAPKAAPAKTAAKPASQLGKRVRDGKFEFTVRSVKCGITKVGDNPYLTEKAQGQFCAVALTVENIGDEPQSMFADNQYAFDSKGRKFSANSKASLVDESSQVLWEEINPGNAVKGKVYFDIPKDAKLTRFQLHDSMFSGGVKVQL